MSEQGGDTRIELMFRLEAALKRIEQLEAALRQIGYGEYRVVETCEKIARAALAPERDTQPRKTFTIPPGYEAVRDSEGRATGEVRPRAAIAPKRQENNDVFPGFRGNNEA